MSRLFAKVYLDEDVDVLLAALLESQGLVALTTRDAGRLKAGDADNLAFATGKEMAILTHNREDFERLAAEWAANNRHHCGIIIAFRKSTRVLARRLIALLNNVSAEEMDDQVFYI